MPQLDFSSFFSQVFFSLVFFFVLHVLLFTFLGRLFFVLKFKNKLKAIFNVFSQKQLIKYTFNFK